MVRHSGYEAAGGDAVVAPDVLLDVDGPRAVSLAGHIPINFRSRSKRSWTWLGWPMASQAVWLRENVLWVPVWPPPRDVRLLADFTLDASTTL
jgi:hypothetical protein